MNKTDHERLPGFVFAASWLTLGVAALVGVLFLSWPYVLGLVAGGLIAVLNLSLLSKTLKTTLSVDGRSGSGSAIFKYYLRFVVSGLVITILLAKGMVHPIGLILGLSVVVAGIFLALFYELTFHIKEAG